MTIEEEALKRYPVINIGIRIYNDANEERREAFIDGFNFAHQCLLDDLAVEAERAMKAYEDYKK